MAASETCPQEKAIAIFRELVGDNADRFRSGFETLRVIKDALLPDSHPKAAADIAFHMTDWSSDAAFVAALLLYPERFTAEEIRDGITGFLVHAPNHLAAAAKLHGFPIQDVFEVGALENGD